MHASNILRNLPDGSILNFADLCKIPIYTILRIPGLCCRILSINFYDI